MRPALISILKLVSTTGAFLSLPHYEGGVLCSPKHLSAVCADGMELTIVNSTGFNRYFWRVFQPRKSSTLMEQVMGFEPTFQPWQGRVLTTVRYLHKSGGTAIPNVLYTNGRIRYWFTSSPT